MPVIGPDGLVGRVVETGPAVARVLLLTDPESLVPVRRTRDGLPAIAAGRGDGDARHPLGARPASASRAGDVFVTTGTGGIYAPGMPVARVAAAGDDTALARQPFAHPDGLDFALVTAALHAAAGATAVTTAARRLRTAALPRKRARALPWANRRRRVAA